MSRPESYHDSNAYFDELIELMVLDLRSMAKCRRVHGEDSIENRVAAADQALYHVIDTWMKVKMSSLPIGAISEQRKILYILENTSPDEVLKMLIANNDQRVDR